LIVAHGGAVGAAFEVGFVLVPIVAFVILAQVSKRRSEGENAAAGACADDPDSS